jgi:hypothetical protein
MISAVEQVWLIHNIRNILKRERYFDLKFRKSFN